MTTTVILNLRYTEQQKADMYSKILNELISAGYEQKTYSIEGTVDFGDATRIVSESGTLTANETEFMNHFIAIFEVEFNHEFSPED